MVWMLMIRRFFTRCHFNKIDGIIFGMYQFREITWCYFLGFDVRELLKNIGVHSFGLNGKDRTAKLITIKKTCNYNTCYSFSYTRIMANQQITDTRQLRSIFVHHLNRMYFGKRYLDSTKDDLIKAASFSNLQLALTEMAEDVKRQICRMDDIFNLINETPSDESCNPFKAIINDDFCLEKLQSALVLKDIDIILYVQLLEHINITSYRMLKMLAHVFNNKEVDQLLIECFDESVEDDRLFVMVTEEYIGKK